MRNLTIKAKTDWREDLRNIPHGFIHCALFAGDRFDCCDEAIIGYLNGEFVGIATLSHKGEYRDGIPDVVGLYVAPAYRRQGYGVKILEAAIKRLAEHHKLPTPIRLTAISSNMIGLHNKLPSKHKVEIIDASMGLNLTD